MEEELFTLISSDGEKILIDRKSIRLSGLLQNILEEYTDVKELLIPEVNCEFLNHVAEYLNQYKDFDPKDVIKPLEKYDIEYCYGKWDEVYISKFKEKKAIVGLMEAATFLDCKSLLELAASNVACIIRNLSGEEMMDYFGLEEDMSEEDVIKMQEEFEKEIAERNAN